MRDRVYLVQFSVNRPIASNVGSSGLTPVSKSDIIDGRNGTERLFRIPPSFLNDLFSRAIHH
jgi:hypothetical protein